ncbi:galactokinase [Blastocladiella emersonii ATCC 22665]|nr:galactokinase [Blastocladiella emersonii ATCC 22665]
MSTSQDIQKKMMELEQQYAIAVKHEQAQELKKRQALKKKPVPERQPPKMQSKMQPPKMQPPKMQPPKQQQPPMKKHDLEHVKRTKENVPSQPQKQGGFRPTMAKVGTAVAVGLGVGGTVSAITAAGQDGQFTPKEALHIGANVVRTTGVLGMGGSALTGYTGKMVRDEQAAAVAVAAEEDMDSADIMARDTAMVDDAELDDEAWLDEDTQDLDTFDPNEYARGVEELDDADVDAHDYEDSADLDVDVDADAYNFDPVEPHQQPQRGSRLCLGAMIGAAASLGAGVLGTAGAVISAAKDSKITPTEFLDIGANAARANGLFGPAGGLATQATGKLVRDEQAAVAAEESVLPADTPMFDPSEYERFGSGADTNVKGSTSRFLADSVDELATHSSSSSHPHTPARASAQSLAAKPDHDADAALASPGRTLPIYPDLETLYASGTHAQRGRVAELVAAFETAFPGVGRPAFIARAPGRVNLIGEHIDYAGFAVMPMAIDRDLLIAVAKRPIPSGTNGARKPRVHVRSAGYPTAVDFDHDHNRGRICTIDAAVLDWGNYFKAGYKGVYAQLALPEPAYDLFCCIHSTVPAGSGLSSSSAMIVATVIATLYAANPARARTVPLEKITNIAIESERLVGVNSGGMDQSISVMGQRGAAAVVHFTPSLRADPLPLPAAGVFVVAHSMVTADKHVTAPRNYNLRVVETRLAAALLAKDADLPLTVPDLHGNPRPVVLADLVPWATCESLGDVAAAIRALAEQAETLLFHGNRGEFGEWSLDEVVAALEVSRDEIRTRYLAAFPVTFHALRLGARTRHVLSEALRVLDAADLLTSTKDPAAAFGKLMDASHASCTDPYECSHTELDMLVWVGKRAGALGSRLTGAGWGGCTVHLLADAREVPEFVGRLFVDYYEPRGVASPESMLDKYVFASAPGPGAGVLTGWD